VSRGAVGAGVGRDAPQAAAAAPSTVPFYGFRQAGVATPPQQHDRLAEYVVHTGSGVFAVPPGAGPGGFVGETLLGAA
jgi:hypothetical protein